MTFPDVRLTEMAELQECFDGDLSPEQQRQVLELAERLQAERSMHVKISELQVAALEAGIQPQYVQQAISMLREKPKTAKRKPKRDSRDLLTLIQWALMALLGVIQFGLYVGGPSASQTLGFILIFISFLLGLTGSTSWRNALRVVVVTPVIVVGLFVTLRIWRELAGLSAPDAEWLLAKELLTLVPISTALGVMLGMFFGWIARQRRENQPA